jgi:hypothetical protein
MAPTNSAAKLIYDGARTSNRFSPDGRSQRLRVDTEDTVGPSGSRPDPLMVKQCPVHVDPDRAQMPDWRHSTYGEAGLLTHPRTLQRANDNR